MQRTLPLGLPFPLHVAHRIDVDLPFNLPFTPDAQTVRSSALDFHFRSNLDGRKLTYSYDLSTRAPGVPVAKLQEHLETIGKILPLLDRGVSYRPGGAVSGPNGVGVAIVIFTTLFGGFGLWRWSRFEPRRLVLSARIPLDPDDAKLAGFDGFLKLVGFGVALRPLMLGGRFVLDASTSFSARTWEAFTARDLATYNPVLAYAIVAEAAATALLCVYAAAIAVLFFSRRVGFRLHFLVGLWAGWVVACVDIVTVGSVAPNKDMAPAIGSSIAFLLWAVVLTAYMRESRRVRATFTRSFSDVDGEEEAPADLNPTEPSTP
jgi:hypothetical protein